MDAVPRIFGPAERPKETRPGLNALMADARRGVFDVVVVWRFDRFARSVTRLRFPTPIGYPFSLLCKSNSACAWNLKKARLKRW